MLVGKSHQRGEAKGAGKRHNVGRTMPEMNSRLPSSHLWGRNETLRVSEHARVHCLSKEEREEKERGVGY